MVAVNVSYFRFQADTATHLLHFGGPAWRTVDPIVKRMEDKFGWRTVFLTLSNRLQNQIFSNPFVC